MSDERVLLLEDDDLIAGAVSRMLERLDYRVSLAESVGRARAMLDQVAFDAAVLDYQLPDGTALEFLPQLQQERLRVPTVILTGHGSIELAVQAMQAGADHFLTKPVELPVLGAIVARLVELGRDQRRHLAEDANRQAKVVDPFRGGGAEMRKLAAHARRVAESGSTVLIQGETGVGKGVLARWIHAHGPRRDEPFVDLNCSALARELIDSELFGHKRGAFTGAVGNKVGLLEVATHGTVFLDEIGDLDPQAQPKLLKALEEQRIRRVGDVTDRAVDVRLLAATHRDLAEAARTGEFRQDLFYRISTVPLRVPPLRERREDIPELARHILHGVAAELGRLSVSLSQACVDAMCSYDWPGNVRELRNVLERAVLLTDRDTLLPKDLLFEESPQDEGAVSLPADLSLEAHERRHIEVVLRLTSGNVAEAARRLQVPRSSLYEKISRHGIDLSEMRT